MPEKRSPKVNQQVVVEKIKKMGKTYAEISAILGIDTTRLKDCLKQRAKHKFSEKEIITISVKLNIKVGEMLADKEDIAYMIEKKRIEETNLRLMKYFSHWHAHEKEEPIKDCRKMKSKAEIVKADKRKYNPMKSAPLPKKEPDPTKVYRINRLGMIVLCEENRNGIKVVYITE